MSVVNLKKMFIAAVVAGAGIVTMSVGGLAPTAAAESCTDGSSYKDFDGSYTSNSLTVWTKDNKKLCNDVKVNFTTFEVLNKNYNGQGFKNNPTALPQSSIFNKTVTLKKGTNGKTTVTMAVPNACTPYQIDAYIGPVQSKITTSAGLVNTTAIVGKLFQKTKNDCTVKVCDPKTGKIITVDESKQANYKPVDDAACKPVVPGDVPVCDPATGDIITVKENMASNYKPVDDAACKDEEQETPPELPTTGPVDSLMGILGLGALTGSATAFIRSRQ